MLTPDVVHLNHGSFGACLRSVFTETSHIRERVEAAPMRYYVRDWQRELDAARVSAAAFVGAVPERFVFVPSATTGLALALASLPLTASDRIVTTTHVYPACRNQLERTGAQIQYVPTPLPFDDDQLVAVIDAALDGARLLVLDHITSPSALIYPLARLVPLAQRRGIPVLIDGAHAPGQLPLEVEALGATWYVGNHHKWMCAPKASGFLAVAPDIAVPPLVTSHGGTAGYGPANRLHAELDWSGTYDPAPILAVPVAIRAVAAEVSDWTFVREHNHVLVQAFTEALDATALSAPSAIGSMQAVAIELPAGLTTSALEQRLLAAGFEVPIVGYLDRPLLRISAHLYNHLDEADALARTLHELGVTVL